MVQLRRRMQQLRVIVRTALLVGNAREQPKWNANSEFAKPAKPV
jgi:hypothetical protein